MHKTTSPKSILVVDDQPTILNTLLRLFKLNGFTVLGCGNGQEALDKFENFKINYVLTDYEMPQMNGFELEHRIHQKFPETPVFLMTGSIFDTDNHNFTEIFYKPFNFTEVVKKIINIESNE